MNPSIKKVLRDRREKIEKIPLGRLTKAQMTIKLLEQKYSAYMLNQQKNSKVEIVFIKDKSGRKVVAAEGPTLVANT